jgi:hypothetical protein
MSRNRNRGRGQQNGGEPKQEQRRKPPTPTVAYTVGLTEDDRGLLIPVCDREEVLQALHELEAIGYRTGGSFVVTPLRAKLGEDEFGDEIYETVGWRIQHFRAPVLPEQTVDRLFGHALHGDDGPEPTESDVQQALDALPPAQRAEAERALAQLTPEEEALVQQAEAQAQPEPVDPAAGREVEVEDESVAASIAQAG